MENSFEEPIYGVLLLDTSINDCREYVAYWAADDWQAKLEASGVGFAKDQGSGRIIHGASLRFKEPWG